MTTHQVPNGTIDGTANASADVPRETEITTAVLQVFTTPQKPAERFELVRVDARNGKNEDGTKRIIAQADRTRCIIIPELSVEGVPSKFQAMILQALRDTAESQLRDLWTADSTLREVPAAIWTVDSLLLYSSRVAESRRLTKAGLELWFNESQLCKRVMATGNAKLLAEWKSRILGMAAPACTLAESQCTAIIVTIAKDETDADSAIGMQLIEKLNKRIEGCKAEQAEIEAV